MNKTEKVIYELLKKSVLFRDEKGIYTIFPQKLLIKASGKSERTIRYVLKNLEDQKYIIRIMYQEVNLMKFYFLKEEDLTGLEIIEVDERLTTSEADRILKETGVAISGRKEHIDKMAAAIILQTYLDMNKELK